MKKTNRGPCRKPATGIAFFGLFTSLLFPLTSTAQNWSIPYYFDDDVKQYSTVLTPNFVSGPHESAMAGTVHYGEDRTDVHFMRCDDVGPILTGTSKIYRHTLTAPFVDSTYMHVVDIEARDRAGANEYFITCLSREHHPFATLNIPYGGTPNRDKITVLKVDDNGALINAYDYTDATGYTNGSGTPYTGGNLYPTNSLYVPASATLYICGYHTWDAHTTLPFQADFRNRKQAFIMAIDANTMNLLTIKTYDYEAATCPDVANGYYDFDIPMRMRLIKNSSSYRDYIFMTGSVNGQQPNNPAFYRSAVMNLVIDPVTLNIMADAPFMSPSDPEVRGMDEYGVDLAETNPIGTSDSGTFIIGNKFTMGERHNDDPAYWGFDPEPHWMWVTEVDRNFLFMTGAPNDKWYVAGGMSGAVLQVLPTNNNIGGSNQNLTPGAVSHFAVAGIQTSMHQNSDCNAPAIWPTLSNVTAFVADLHVDYTSLGLYIPTASPPVYERVYGTNWTTYDNNSGTGNTGIWNNYTYMGGGIANIAWNPIAAARDNAANDVVLNAPKFGTNISGDNVLGIKWIRPINSGSSIGYDLPSGNMCVVEACAPRFIEEPVTHFPPVATDGTLTITVEKVTPFINVASYRIPDPYVCSTPDGDPDNKPTKIDPAKNAAGTILYPNPASTEISIDLSANIAEGANVQVQLYNLYGQKIATLYKGKAVSLTPNTRLQLPGVASGLYLVQVTADTKIVLQQKLTIQ